MAQTGYTPISIYYSSTASNTPTAGNLVAGELAINTADGKLFYKDSAGVVQVIGTKGGVGSSTTTQVLYNSSGLVVGSANMTFNGTTLTLANDASISGLTVGKGSGSVSNNTALGYQAGYSNTSGARNTFAGYGAGYSNTTGLANTFVGGPDATGGYSAGYSNTSGSYNVALGDGSLGANTTASNNTAVGYQAGYSNVTGLYNTFIGTQAGYTSAVSGNAGNTCVGFQVGYSLTTGIKNTFIGGNANYSSGTSITTGSGNTIIGAYTGNQGGLDIRTSSNYIVLSDGDGNPRGIFNNTGALLIGTTNQYGSGKVSIPYSDSAFGISMQSTTASAINYAIEFKNSSGSGVGYISASTTTTTYNITSDQRLKTNIVDAPLGNISDIKVRSFDWKLDNSHVDYGFIAQELLEVAPYAVSQPKNSDEMMGVDYSKLIPMMVKEIQELKKRIATLENK